MEVTTKVKERPILFRGEMVRAILDGRKTQTRRLVKPQPALGESVGPCGWSRTGWAYCEDPATHEPAGCFCRPVRFPYGDDTGDHLWVRETWAVSGHYKDGPRYEYRAFPADGEHFRSVGRWKPSIHMPRSACRLILEIIDVRVERLSDISHEDAIAEGCRGYNWVASSPYFSGPHTDDGELPQEEFQTLWESINGVGSWAANPWVWVVSFRRVEGWK